MKLEALHQDDILRCDDAMMRWAADQSDLSYPPVVRARTYRTLRHDLSVYSRHFSAWDNRIPVVMKGAKWALPQKYRTKSAYGSILIDRFLRRIRFTSSNAKKRHAMRCWLINRLDEKGIDWRGQDILSISFKWVDGRKLLSNGEEIPLAPEVVTSPPRSASSFASIEITRSMRARAAMLALDELGIKI